MKENNMTAVNFLKYKFKQNEKMNEWIMYMSDSLLEGVRKIFVASEYWRW